MQFIRLLTGVQGELGKTAMTDEKSLLMHDGKKKLEPVSIAEALSKSFEIMKDVYDNLFANTTGLDTLILLLGTLFAFIHGITFPFVAIVFGSLTNSYIQQAIHGYANSSSAGTLTTVGLYNFTESLFNEFNQTNDKPINLPTGSQLGISEDISSTFDLINKVVLQTFTEEQALTKEEFIAYVHVTGTLFFILAIIIFLSSFFQVLCWELVAVNQAYRLRQSVITKILGNDMTWFGQHDRSELVTNIFSGVELVRNGIGFKFSNIIEYSAMFVAAVVIAISTSWHVSVVFLIPIPFILYRILSFGQTIAEESTQRNVKWNKAEEISAEILSNMDTVVAFGEQESSIRNYGAALKAAVTNTCVQYGLTALGSSFLTAIVYGSYAVAFWYGCRLLMQSVLSPGEIYTVFLSITMGSLAISHIVTIVPVISSSYGSAKNLKACIETSTVASSNSDDEQTISESFEGGIEFKHVNFAYPGGKQILNDLSFKIEAGKTVAIVSEVGMGKTTIGNLLLRLYEPTNGEIKIDNYSLDKLNVEALRKNVGISLQNNCLNDSIVEEIIRSGRSYVRDADITKAKAIVGMLQTTESTDGIPEIEPSVGVWSPADFLRKLNIARSLTHQPSILILDESFSELPDSDQKTVRSQVLESRKGRTTIILTNRFLQVKDVDQIYVLNKEGQILEKNIGTHSELMERENSYYALMINSELKFQKLKEEMADGIVINYGKSQFGILFARQPTIWDFIKSLIRPEIKSTWMIGFLGCFMTGVQVAIFAFYFVEIFGTFSKTGPKLADDGIFWAGMLILLAIISAFGIWLRTFYISSAGLDLISELKSATLTSVLTRPKCYYNESKTTPEALGTKMMRNAPFIQSALEYQLPEGVSTIVTLFFIGIIICLLVWQVGLIAVFGVLPILILLATVQFKYQKAGRQTINEADENTSTIVSTALGTMELTHIFCMQKHYIEKYSEAALPAYNEAQKQACIFSILFALCETVFFLFCGVSFIFGAYLIQVDLTEPQLLFKIFFSTAFCILLFSQIVSFMPDLAGAMFSLEQFHGLIHAYFGDDSITGMQDLDKVDGEDDRVPLGGNTEFQNVVFKYGSHTVLDGLNFTIPVGSTLSITGPPGFGGTTILYLLQRFYDPNRGTLFIDGEESNTYIIKNFSPVQLRLYRQQIGWLPQNILFFDGSLAYNINYGCKDKLTPDALQQLLSTVQLYDEFKNELELGTIHDKEYWMNTLSRGKKVLLAIARAIARKPKILLLDRPTYLLSPEEEEKVLNVIKEVKKNRTCVIISYVPSTLSLADSIVVVQDGKVLEQGTVTELRSRDGYYSDLVKNLKKI